MHNRRSAAQAMERAKALLAAGATVTDACLEVGFSSLGSSRGCPEPDGHVNRCSSSWILEARWEVP